MRSEETYTATASTANSQAASPRRLQFPTSYSGTVSTTTKIRDIIKLLKTQNITERIIWVKYLTNESKTVDKSETT